MPKRAGERVMQAVDDEPARVWVPNALWKARSIPPGAKILWCYLRIARHTRTRFRFRELREAIGVSQNSLAAYLKQLEAAGWLRVLERRRYSISCTARWKGQGPAIVMASDVLFDARLPDQAKWLWGLIARQVRPFTYQFLERETGFCRETLVKYLRLLSQLGWLQENRSWKNRRVLFRAVALNPAKERRDAEIAAREKAYALAGTIPGYSRGQHIMTELVEFLVPDGELIKNAEMVGLMNPETGGQMHLDLYLARYKVALEFHGPQHDRLTERHPDPQELEAQRRRDRLKAAWCRERGIELIIVRAENLDFDWLIPRLEPHVKLNTDKRGRWHVFRYLERLARNYREKVAALEQQERKGIAAVNTAAAK